MPELPEVETIRTALEANIGAGITHADIKRFDIIKQEDFPPAEINGRIIQAIKRRGKYLILVLDKGYFLVVHLGMSGRFYMQEEEGELTAPHIHFVLHLNNGQKLVYEDARRFGGIRLCFDPETMLAHMGIEPLSRQFTVKYLTQICRQRKVPIKTLLLNQNLIAGIGNIYADEALFTAGIRGHRPAGTLSAAEIRRLRRAIVQVLQQSIEERGTTFRDFRDGFNRSGNFQNSLKVYGRTNQSCCQCGGIIKKEIIGGRGSHYCEHCQQ